MLAPHTEADPVGLLGDFLASFGNCVGRGPHAMACAARHPARLNIALVGETARGRKGTARAAIRELFREADPVWSKARVQHGLSTGEGLITAVADPVYDDAGKLLSGSEDRRLLVVEPEFARVLTVAGRDGNTLSPVVRDAWDSGDLGVLTRREPLRASGSLVSLVVHVTPEELSQRLTSTDIANGFANRFLFLLVRRPHGHLLPFGGELDPDEQHRMARLVASALTEARKFALIRFSDEAKPMWDSLYRELATSSHKGLLGAVLARADAQMLRLAVTYAIADGSRWIEPVHLSALWRYAADSARSIFGDSTGDEVVDKLRRAIEGAGPEGLDGMAQHRLFAGHASKDRLEKARARLESDGLIVTYRQPTPGRDRLVSYSSRYGAVSALTPTLTAPTALCAEKRREESVYEA